MYNVAATNVVTMLQGTVTLYANNLVIHNVVATGSLLGVYRFSSPQYCRNIERERRKERESEGVDNYIPEKCKFSGI